MKIAAQLVAELFWSDASKDAAAAATSNTASLAAAGDYTEIPLDDDIESWGSSSQEEYAIQSWAYYVDEFGRPPAHNGDLLLGIGMGRDGIIWWVPSVHPIAKLLIGHGIEPQLKRASFYCYDRNTLVLGQRSLAALLVDRALRNEGMLAADDDDDNVDDADDE